MYKALLALSLLGLGVGTQAQITGDTVVCSGRIYTYTADVPGAFSHEWSFPNGWYDASGWGTEQVTITCNVSAGDVCVTAEDTLGSSLGTYCIPTEFGGGGAGFDVQPASVQGCSMAEVMLTMVPNGTGGGCAECGGTQHANIAHAIYLNSVFFVGFLGSSVTVFPPGGTLTVVQVDYTNGTSPADAIVISGGCGGSGSSSSQATVFQQLYPVFLQQPEEVCVGEIVTVQVVNADWGDFHDLVDLDATNTSGSLNAAVIGPNASYVFTGIDAVGCPMEEVAHSINYCITTDAGGTMTVDAAPTLVPAADHTFVIVPSSAADPLEQVKVLSLSGALLTSTGSNRVDLYDYPSGLYLIEAHCATGSVAQWKVAR